MPALSRTKPRLVSIGRQASRTAKVAYQIMHLHGSVCVMHARQANLSRHTSVSPQFTWSVILSPEIIAFSSHQLIEPARCIAATLIIHTALNHHHTHGIDHCLQTSLCSASCVRWQRDTARICCWVPGSNDWYLLLAGPTAANRCAQLSYAKQLGAVSDYHSSL